MKLRFVASWWIWTGGCALVAFEGALIIPGAVDYTPPASDVISSGANLLVVLLGSVAVIAQWRLLAGRGLPQAWKWIPASAAGAIASFWGLSLQERVTDTGPSGLLASWGVSHMLLGISPPSRDALLALLAGVAFVGIFAAQWIVLRHWVQTAWPWVVVGPLSMMTGFLIVALYVDSYGPYSLNILPATLPGIVQALVIDRLVGSRPREASL